MKISVQLTVHILLKEFNFWLFSKHFPMKESLQVHVNQYTPICSQTLVYMVRNHLKRCTTKIEIGQVHPFFNEFQITKRYFWGKMS